MLAIGFLGEVAQVIFAVAALVAAVVLLLGRRDIKTMKASVGSVEVQLTTNGGSTVRDAIQHLQGEVASIKAHLGIDDEAKEAAT